MALETKHPRLGAGLSDAEIESVTVGMETLLGFVGDTDRRQPVRKPSHIPQPILQPIPFRSVLPELGRRRKTEIARIAWIFNRLARWNRRGTMLVDRQCSGGGSGIRTHDTVARIHAF